jgi:hypothetical protein
MLLAGAREPARDAAHAGSAPAGDQADSSSCSVQGGLGGCRGTNFVNRHTDGAAASRCTYDSAGNRLHRPRDRACRDYSTTSTVSSPARAARQPSGWRREDVTYYAPLAGYQNGYLKSVRVDAQISPLTTCGNDCAGNVRTIDPKGDTLLVNALDRSCARLAAARRKRRRPASLRRDVYDNDNVARLDVLHVDELGVVQPNATDDDLRIRVLNRLVVPTREVGAGSGIVEYAYDGNRNHARPRRGDEQRRSVEPGHAALRRARLPAKTRARERAAVGDLLRLRPQS